MTNDKIAISRAKSLLRKYKLGKVTLDNLVYIIEDQGYEIIEYSLGEKNNILKVEDLHLDLEFKRCTVDGEEVKLARKEFELLVYLVKHRGKICSREQILSRVWSDEVVVLDRTIDVNITRLRSKIGAYGSYIVTRSGFGYGFRD